MTLSNAEKIAALKNEKADLANRISQLEAIESERKRKLDTRRKIVAGGVVLAHAARNRDFKPVLRQLLDRFVEKPSERALFLDDYDLSELAPTTAEGVAAAVAADS